MVFFEENDLDFLVHFGKIEVVDYFDNLMDFKEKLENLFHKKVDLLEIQALKNPFLKENIDTLKFWFTLQENKRLFPIFTKKKYTPIKSQLILDLEKEIG